MRPQPVAVPDPPGQPLFKGLDQLEVNAANPAFTRNMDRRGINAVPATPQWTFKDAQNERNAAIPHRIGDWVEMSLLNADGLFDIKTMHVFLIGVAELRAVRAFSPIDVSRTRTSPPKATNCAPFGRLMECCDDLVQGLFTFEPDRGNLCDGNVERMGFGHGSIRSRGYVGVGGFSSQAIAQGSPAPERDLGWVKKLSGVSCSTISPPSMKMTRSATRRANPIYHA